MTNFPDSEKVMAKAKEVVEARPSIAHTPLLLPTSYLAVLPGRVRVFHHMFQDRNLADQFEVTVSYRAEGIQRFYGTLHESFYSGWERWIMDRFGRFKDLSLGEESAVKIALLSADPNGWGDLYGDPRFSLDLKRNLETQVIKEITIGTRGLDHTPEATAIRRARRLEGLTFRSYKALPVEPATAEDLEAFSFILDKIQAAK